MGRNTYAEEGGNGECCDRVKAMFILDTHPNLLHFRSALPSSPTRHPLPKTRTCAQLGSRETRVEAVGQIEEKREGSGRACPCWKRAVVWP